MTDEFRKSGNPAGIDSAGYGSSDEHSAMDRSKSYAEKGDESPSGAPPQALAEIQQLYATHDIIWELAMLSEPARADGTALTRIDMGLIDDVMAMLMDPGLADDFRARLRTLLSDTARQALSRQN